VSVPLDKRPEQAYERTGALPNPIAVVPRLMPEVKGLAYLATNQGPLAQGLYIG